MIAFLRQLVLLAAAAALSWWVLLRTPEQEQQRPDPTPPTVLAVSLTPSQEHAPPVPSTPSSHAADPLPDPVADSGSAAAPVEASAPPPPERGAPEGEETGEAAPVAAEPPDEEPDEPEPAEEVAQSEPESEPESEVEEPTEEQGARAEELQRDSALLAAARAELAGEVRRGFSTDFLARPEDQVAIAEYFGEELVLVPRGALDPEATSPRWFRLGAGARVETVQTRPPLEQYRQYRDLFAYEYARLPAALRTLRRSVLSREEIYLFAALLPPAEWALVIGRRGEALARAGRELDDVRRFVLRYVRRGPDAFDVEVREILFTDGTRYRPAVSDSGG